MFLHLLNTWVLIAAGLLLVLFDINNFKRRKKKRSPTSPPSSLLTILGFIMLMFGLYAGFSGTAKIGSVKLKSFWFFKTVSQAQKEAFRYARYNITFSSKPPAGWGGNSGKMLLYQIKNNGNRSISTIMLRFRTTSGGAESVVDLKLRGPFFAKETTKAHLSVPEKVQRFYLEDTPIGDVNQIVAATF